MSANRVDATSVLEVLPADVTALDFEESPKEVDTDTITVDDVQLEERSLNATISKTYALHPLSFLVSLMLILFGFINILGFIILGNFITHPYIALSILIAGLGMVTTMYVASK